MTSTTRPASRQRTPADDALQRLHDAKSIDAKTQASNELDGLPIESVLAAISTVPDNGADCFESAAMLRRRFAQTPPNLADHKEVAFKAIGRMHWEWKFAEVLLPHVGFTPEDLRRVPHVAEFHLNLAFGTEWKGHAASSNMDYFLAKPRLSVLDCIASGLVHSNHPSQFVFGLLCDKRASSVVMDPVKVALLLPCHQTISVEHAKGLADRMDHTRIGSFFTWILESNEAFHRLRAALGVLWQLIEEHGVGRQTLEDFVTKAYESILDYMTEPLNDALPGNTMVLEQRRKRVGRNDSFEALLPAEKDEQATLAIALNGQYDPRLRVAALRRLYTSADNATLVRVANLATSLGDSVEMYKAALKHLALLRTLWRNHRAGVFGVLRKDSDLRCHFRELEIAEEVHRFIFAELGQESLELLEAIALVYLTSVDATERALQIKAIRIICAYEDWNGDYNRASHFNASRRILKATEGEEAAQLLVGIESFAHTL